VTTVIQGGSSSVTALTGSTEEAQFHSVPPPSVQTNDGRPDPGAADAAPALRRSNSIRVFRVSRAASAVSGAAGRRQGCRGPSMNRDQAAMAASGAAFANGSNDGADVAVRTPLSFAEFVLFRECGQARQLAAGEALFRRGDLGTTMYVIEQGAVELDFGEDLPPSIWGRWSSSASSAC
jgi:hypothetical protein